MGCCLELLNPVPQAQGWGRMQMSCSQMFRAEGEKGGAPGLGGLWLRHMQRLRLRPALAGMVGVWAAQAGPPLIPHCGSESAPPGSTHTASGKGQGGAVQGCVGQRRGVGGLRERGWAPHRVRGTCASPLAARGHSLPPGGLGGLPGVSPLEVQGCGASECPWPPAAVLQELGGGPS